VAISCRACASGADDGARVVLLPKDEKLPCVNGRTERGRRRRAAAGLDGAVVGGDGGGDATDGAGRRPRDRCWRGHGRCLCGFVPTAMACGGTDDVPGIVGGDDIAYGQVQL